MSDKDDLTKDPLLSVTTRDAGGQPSLGGITLTKKLGQGGMGAVYRGSHPRLGVEVAVKVLPFHLAGAGTQAVDYFMREARVAARLNHPNLVRIFDVNSDKDPRTGTDVYYLIMEFVPGTTAGGLLRDHVKSGKGLLPEADALDVVIAATQGLVAAHDENIVHRDIKPDNIIVPINDKGEPQLRKAKLMDLGLAKNTDDGQSIGLTAANVAMGTPGYMSPEQAESAKDAGPTADVFSMGATLYAMLAGTAPFSGTTVLNILRKTAGEAHPPLRQINPNVTAGTAHIVDTCLAKNPAQRYQTAAKLLDALNIARNALKEDAPTDKTLVALQSFAPLEITEKTVVRATPAPGSGMSEPTKATAIVGQVPAAPATPPAKKATPVAWIVAAVVLVAAAVGGVLAFSGPGKPSFARLMEQAGQAADGGDWKGAIALYEQAVKLNPSPEAEKKLAEARGVVEKRQKYDHEIAAGREAVDRKDWLDAEGHFSAAKNLIDGPEAKEGLAKVLESIGGAYADASRHAQEAMEKRDWDRAEAAWKDALKAQPTAEGARKGIEEVARRREGERKALAKLEEARGKADSDPETAWKLLGEAVEADDRLYKVRAAAVAFILQARRPEWVDDALRHAQKAEELASSDEEKRKSSEAREQLSKLKEKAAQVLALIARIEKAVEEEDWDGAEKAFEEFRRDGHPRGPRAELAEKRLKAGREWFAAMKEGKEAEDRREMARARAAYEKAEAIWSRPASKTALDRVRDAGTVRETAKSGLGPTQELIFTADRRHVVASSPTYESPAFWDAGTLEGSFDGRKAGERDAHCMRVAPMKDGSMVSLVWTPLGERSDRYQVAFSDPRSSKPRIFKADMGVLGSSPVSATNIGPMPDGEGLVRVMVSAHGDQGVDACALDIISSSGGEVIRSLGKFTGQAFGLIRSSAELNQFAIGGGTYRVWEQEGKDWKLKDVVEGTTIQLFDASTFDQRVVQLGAESGELKTFAYSPEGKVLLAGSKGGRVSVVDPSTGDIKARIELGAEIVSVSPSDRGIGAAVAGGKVVFLDLEKGRAIDGVDAPTKVRSALLSADGAVLYVGHEDNRVRRYSVGRLQ